MLEKSQRDILTTAALSQLTTGCCGLTQKHTQAPSPVPTSPPQSAAPEEAWVTPLPYQA